MYAVIRAGGKQYRVAPGDVIKIENSSSTKVDSHGKFHFAPADVLAVSVEPGQITKPNGGGATVIGQVVDEGRAKKILVFHFKRKKQYKKLQGHRQGYTAVRISEISYDGHKATAPELAARKPKKKAETHAAPVKAKAANRANKVKVAAKRTAPKAAATKKAAAKKTSKKK